MRGVHVAGARGARTCIEEEDCPHDKWTAHLESVTKSQPANKVCPSASSVGASPCHRKCTLEGFAASTDTITAQALTATVETSWAAVLLSFLELHFQALPEDLVA